MINWILADNILKNYYFSECTFRYLQPEWPSTRVISLDSLFLKYSIRIPQAVSSSLGVIN